MKRKTSSSTLESGSDILSPKKNFRQMDDCENILHTVSYHSKDMPGYFAFLVEIRDKLRNITTDATKYESYVVDGLASTDFKLQHIHIVRESKEERILIRAEHNIIAAELLAKNLCRRPSLIRYVLIGSLGVGKSLFLRVILPAMFLKLLASNETPLRQIAISISQKKYLIIEKEKAFLIEKGTLPHPTTCLVICDHDDGSSDIIQIPGSCISISAVQSPDLTKILNELGVSFREIRTIILNPWLREHHALLGAISKSEFNKFQPLSPATYPLPTNQKYSPVFLDTKRPPIHQALSSTILSFSNQYYVVSSDESSPNASMVCTANSPLKNRIYTEFSVEWSPDWNYFTPTFKSPECMENVFNFLSASENSILASEVAFAIYSLNGLFYEISFTSRLIANNFDLKNTLNISNNQGKNEKETSINFNYQSSMRIRELDDIPEKPSDNQCTGKVLYWPRTLNFQGVDVFFLQDMKLYCFQVTLALRRDVAKDCLRFTELLDFCMKRKYSCQWVYILPGSKMQAYRQIAKKLLESCCSTHMKTKKKFWDIHLATFDSHDAAETAELTLRKNWKYVRKRFHS